MILLSVRRIVALWVTVTLKQEEALHDWFVYREFQGRQHLKDRF